MFYYVNFEDNDLPSYRLFVHIGMPKSGSSFLQQYVFASISKESDLSVHGEKQDSIKIILDTLAEKKQSECNKNVVSIFSNEALCGMWHHGIEFSGWDCFKSFLSAADKSERHTIILFVLRDLGSYTWSMYLDQLKKGKIKKGYGDFLSQFKHEDLSIERRLREMADRNLVVLWHHDLLEKQEEVLSFMAKYLGVSASQFGELEGVKSNLTPKKNISLLAHRLFCKTSMAIERGEKTLNSISHRLLGRALVREHYLATKRRRDALTVKIESLPFGKSLQRENPPDEWELFFVSDMEKSMALLSSVFEFKQA